MKPRSLAFVVLLSLVFGFASSLVVAQRASAACYDQQKNEVPCPKDDKKKPPTAVPTKVPPTPTNAPVAVQSIVIATPNADQLKTYCASFAAPAANSPTGSQGSTTGPGTGGNGGLIGNGGAGFTGPITFGGGGLLVGILIGLLVPAVRNRWNGDGRSFTGGVFAPTDDKFGSSPTDKQGQAAALFIKHGGSPTDKVGEVATFLKQDPMSQKLSGGSFDKDDEAGLNYSKLGDGSVRPSGEAGMQDFHNSAGQFQKGMDTKFNGDGNYTGDGNLTGNG